MKKKLSLFFAVIVLLLTGQTAVAQTFVVDNLSFTVTDADAKTVSVSKTDGISGNVVIPASVTNEGVTYSVTLVAAYGFESTAITGVTIPASVTKIGDRAFASCGNLVNVRIEDSEVALTMTAGYYGSFNWSTADKTVYIGRNITLNENSAPFSNATSVEFSDKVTTINDKLFYDNKKLSSITIGNGVTTIGSSAFSSVGTDDGVEELQVTLGSNIEIIKESAFNSCSKLKTITLPSTLEVIEGYAFGNTSLTAVTIPESVDSLGQRAFGSCASLATITIADKAEPLKMWSGYYGSFKYSEADKTVYIGREMKLNEASAPFINVTAVEFGDYITAIPDNMFNDVTKLAQVTIGNGVKTIGNRAFNNVGTDDSIEELVVTMGSKVETIEEYAFNGCTKLKSITLPATLEVIKGYAFSNTGLAAVTIPESVDSLGQRAFGSCASLATITIADKAEPLKMWSGYNGSFKYSEADKTVYIGRDLKMNENSAPFSNPLSVTFGDQVTTITPSFLDGASKLPQIVIGNGVTTIGNYAFRGVGTDDSIEELKVTMGANVVTIGNGLFENCSKLKEVVLPATLTAIPEYTFSGTGLTSVNIPAKTTGVGNRAFAHCANLTEITIEDGNTPLPFSVGYNGVFYGSDAANKKVYIGRDLSYEDGAVLVSNVSTVEFGPLVTTIKPKLFEGVTLTSIKAPWIETIINCPENAFNAETYSGATLWVPGGTMDAYKAADYWKNFTNMDYWSFVVTVKSDKNGTLAVADIVSTNNDQQLTRINRETETVFTATPNIGYELDAFTVNETAQTLTEGKYTIASLLADQAAVVTWKPIIYPITYTLAGGTVATENPATYTIESAAITLNNPTRKGYTFEGWTGTDLTEPTKTVIIPAGSTGERSYTATWKVITYTLTYDLAGGALADGESNPATYTIESDAIILVNPTRKGYDFAGWTGTELTEPTMTVTIAKGSTENRSYTATWTPITYTISYDLAGGALADGTTNPATYTIESDAIILVNPTRKGYDFAGWTGTELTEPTKTVTIAKGSTENRSYTATWTPITYTISYDLAGGALADGTTNPATYTIESDAITLVNPTRKGYDFAGWTGTELTEPTKTVTIAKGSTENRSYTATWTPVTYTISYDLAGGALADGATNPATYTIESDAITLVNPTREGYSFDGWTGTELTEPTKTVTIAKGSTGDRSYTANWTRNAFVLSDTDSESTNASLLSAWNGKVADVTLSGRTLNKNNEWNTICLPFDLTIAGSVLDGAEVRTLASTTLAGQNLSMTFSDNLTEMEAGKPYVIRWTSGEPLVNPTFEGVTVKNANVKTNSITTDYVTFTGTYTPTALVKDDVTNLYLASGNKLYYPNVDGFKVNAFRGYFKVDDSAAAMGLNITTDLGDGSTTRIQGLEKAGSELDSWYTLNGVKLDGKPTQKGVFIHNGKKVVIK